MKIVDPVCGMAMDEKDIFETSLYKGSLYYFCSKECKENFDRDPETLLGMKQAREKKAEEERSRVLEKVMDELAHGPGLGLTFTQRIIQEHGGSISVDSEPGKGAIFTIRLPFE